MLHKKSLKLLKLAFFTLLVIPLSFETSSDISQKYDNVCINSESPCIINSHTIKIDIISVDDIIVIEEFIFKNNYTDPIEGINLWLNQSFSNLAIEDSYSYLEFNFINNTNLLSIDFIDTLEVNQTAFVKISYTLDGHMEKIGKDPAYYLFSFSPSMTYFTLKQHIDLKLPATCYIHYGGTPIDIHPDTGPPVDIGNQRLMLQWSFADLIPFDIEHFIIVCFDEPILKEPIIWPFIVSPIFGLAAGVTGTVWFMRRREKRAIKKIGEIFLTDNQKQFLKIIIENGGKISQKELTTITGYTKNKVSRNLISLEQQQLIIREKWGRNYRIYITETGERVAK